MTRNFKCNKLEQMLEDDSNEKDDGCCMASHLLTPAWRRLRCGRVLRGCLGVGERLKVCVCVGVGV